MSRHDTEHDDIDVVGHEDVYPISWIVRILGKPSNVSLPQIDVPGLQCIH